MRNNQWIFFSFLLVAVSGCGGDGSFSSTGGVKTQESGISATKPSGNPSVDCENFWKSEVGSNPKGMVKRYENSITQTANPSAARRFEEMEQVIESNDDLILIYKTNRTIRVFYNDYIESCKSILSRGGTIVPIINVGQGSGATILERRDERISVKAGSYDCEYIKSKVNVISSGNSMESIEVLSEQWVSKNTPSKVVIKSIMLTPMGPGNVQTLVRELVEFSLR
ncbi:MAG: hypothetical protein HQK50_00650 [Oligoflexia bacterium]|nr:hypothetical protein [Oligoflexia bacterium]MBF0364044.1 hypothetical protein [Oligoflexia bacterium]